MPTGVMRLSPFPEPTKRSFYSADDGDGATDEARTDDGGISAASAVADLNGDGRPDVACIGMATSNLKWYRTRPTRQLLAQNSHKEAKNHKREEQSSSLCAFCAFSWLILWRKEDHKLRERAVDRRQQSLRITHRFGQSGNRVIGILLVLECHHVLVLYLQQRLEN